MGVRSVLVPPNLQLVGVMTAEAWVPLPVDAPHEAPDCGLCGDPIPFGDEALLYRDGQGIPTYVHVVPCLDELLAEEQA